MDSKILLFVSVAALAAGCGDSHAPAGAPLDGGVMVMFAEPEGLVFGADVYSSASAPFPMPGLVGGCEVTPHTQAGTHVIDAVDVDFGPSLTLFSCAGSLDVPKDGGSYSQILEGRQAVPGAERFDVHHEPVQQYLGGFAGLPAFGSTWAVMAGETTLATVTLPGQVFQDSSTQGSGSLTPGKSATVSWTGGEGAAFFHVFADGMDASADCYVPADQTSFELSGTITAALGEDAFAAVSAESVQVVDVGGRNVLVVSGADNLD